MRILLCLVFACSLAAQTAPYLVKDLEPGPGSIDIYPYVVVGGRLYFNRTGFTETFWRTDGTADGTLEIHGSDRAAGITRVQGQSLIFQTYKDDLLWKTDGTPQGTKRVDDVVQGFEAQEGFVFGSRILVFRYRELWSAPWPEGQPAVRLVADADFAQFASLAGRAYFISDGGLWRTDGTPEGTYVAAHLGEGELPSTPIVPMGGHLYWAANYGKDLWRSDGTPDGTRFVATIPKAVRIFLPAETQLFFIDETDRRLWVTDGTAAGTRELPARPVDSAPPVILRDTVVFPQGDGAGGTDIWVSDGTAEGTHMIHNVETNESTLTRAGALAYIAGEGIETGAELWSTDGTAAGTKLVSDIWPGFPGSHPDRLAAAGDRLFFTARTPETGRELWAVALPPAPRITIEDARAGEADSTLELTVSLSSPAKETATVAFTTRDGTAAGGSDYEAAAGTLTFQPGESSKRVTVRLRPDAETEENETFLLALQNAAGATIEKGTAAGIIDDDDRHADLRATLDFSQFAFKQVWVEVTNAGPDTVTTLRLRQSCTPNPGLGVHFSPAAAPGGGMRVLGTGTELSQKYCSASIGAHDPDPDASNDTVAWTVNNTIAMDAAFLTPGAEARVWVTSSVAGNATIATFGASVLDVPGSVATPAGQPASFTVRGFAPGRTTLRVRTADQVLHTLDVDVLQAGTRPRWPGGVSTNIDNTERSLEKPVTVFIRPTGRAPLSGATATGRVTVTANGVELGRVQLTPQSTGDQVLQVLLAEVGVTTLDIDYEGDANFLPQRQTWKPRRTEGQVTFNATAVRNGSTLTLRAYLSGSPAASPGGTIRFGGGAEIPLTTIRPGLVVATTTIEGFPEEVPSMVLTYSGDSRYLGAQHTVPIGTSRRRVVR